MKKPRYPILASIVTGTGTLFVLASVWMVNPAAAFLGSTVALASLLVLFWLSGHFETDGGHPK